MKRNFSSKAPKLIAMAALAAITQPASHAISLIANGNLSGNLTDYSGLSDPLENDVAGNLLGGMGSGLAWAGGDTFLALPDRGPNAVGWNSAVDDTTSYVSRFQTLQLDLTPSGGALPFTLTPTVTGTTLLYNSSSLNYGAATPAINTASKYYFTGRSDAFAPGLSTNPSNGRLDPESIRISNDGTKAYVSDEYGPYVYQFNRYTGEREKVFTLPNEFAISNQSSKGSIEISGNTTGRVANKGMEGLAITPNGKTLVGFMQSPLIQDGGDGGRANRIVTVDVETGAVKQFAYDNRVGTKNFNSSEILALNDHQFLVLERDGKGLGDNSTAAFKQIYLVDIAGAQDVTGLSGEAALVAKAPTKTLFLDIRQALNAAGISDTKIPAKLEGMAFGEDVVVNGVLTHTLFVANDNDFLAADAAGNANPNQWFVFGVSDADLLASNADYEAQALPDSNTSSAMLLAAPTAGLLLLGRKRRTVAQ